MSGPLFVGERTAHNSVRVYTTDERPRLVTTIRLPDLGAVDDTLHEYGFRVVGEWARSDDMPEGHAVASLERFRGVPGDDDPEVDLFGYGDDGVYT